VNRKCQVLVVDDEKEVGTFFRHLLEKYCDVTVVTSGREALELCQRRQFKLALIDLKMPDMDGLVFLKAFKAANPGSQAIIMTGYGTVKTAVKAIQLGAFDYIEKPFEDIDVLEELVRRALSGEEIEQEPVFHDGLVVGRNQEMRAVVATASKIAPKNLTVLIEGETGTGKEVLARYIHRMSRRSDGPFIAVNCGALAETLLESELFGHEKGSFTGAVAQRKGLFEIADRGTLLLDELSEASLGLQVKLLRVLETREFRRIGGEKSYRCDVRVIATTNVNLWEMVKQGRFREDLYYRLNTVVLKIPPLRRRKEDIPLLVEHIVQAHFEEEGVSFSPEAMSLMVSYPWPGNVRELINVVGNTLALRDGPVIMPHHLPEKIKGGAEFQAYRGAKEGLAYEIERLFRGYAENWDPEMGHKPTEIMGVIKEAQENLIRDIIVKCLRLTAGDRNKAAEMLELTPRQIRYYLNEK